MDWRDRIEINQRIMVGKPVVKGTRLTVEFIVELLANGWSHSEIIENYPGITDKDITACLAYAVETFRVRRTAQNQAFA